MTDIQASRPSLKEAANGKKGVFLMNRIGPSSSALWIADAMTGEIADLLDAGFGLLARSLARRRPQHDDVLAQDGDGLGAVGHFLVAARDREIGLMGPKHSDAVDRTGRADQR